MTRKQALIKLIVHTLMCLSLSIAIVSACALYANYMAENDTMLQEENNSDIVASDDATGSNTEPVVPVNLCRQYTEINDDVTGKIVIDSIDVEEPIMHTPTDQNSYLYKDINGEYSKAGSLFTAADAVLGKTEVSTIYGHSMGNGTMFGKLKKYRDVNFVKENQFFTVSSLWEEFSCQIVAVCDVSSDYIANGWYYPQANLTDDEMTNFQYQCQVRSYFTTNAEWSLDDKYIILSTCSYAFEGERLIIVAKIVDENAKTIEFSKNPLVLRADEYYEVKGTQKPSAEKIHQNYINNIK